jgi:lysophospholipase L1-like esterase
MKIVFLGDSLIWGQYGGNFVAEIAARKPEHTLINAGQVGNTILNLLQRLDDVLALEPDGIFIAVGGNDAISYSQPATRPYYRQVQGVPNGIVTPDLFVRSYRDLLTRVQLAHVLAWVALEPAEYNPEVVTAVREFNGLAKATAESFSIPVLNLMTRLTPVHIPQRPPLTLNDINRIGQRIASGWADYEAERQREGYSFSFDGLHLTPETARHVAEWVIEFLRL